MSCAAGRCSGVIFHRASFPASGPNVSRLGVSPACKTKSATFRQSRRSSRQRLQPALAASDPDFDVAEAEGIEDVPEDARGAIAVGLKYYKAGNYQKALELFGKAPALPGTGTKRFRYCSTPQQQVNLCHNVARVLSSEESAMAAHGSSAANVPGSMIHHQITNHSAFSESCQMLFNLKVIISRLSAAKGSVRLSLLQLHM